MRIVVILMALTGCVALGAQEHRTSFTHRGANAAYGLGYDDQGNFYTVSGSPGASDTVLPGPANDSSLDTLGQGVIVTKHALDDSLVWVRWIAGVQNVLGAAVSRSGDVYIPGGFKGQVDFDPGPGQALRQSMSLSSGVYVPNDNNFNACLLKLNSDGEFQWVRTWVASGWAFGENVAISPDGNVHMYGVHMGLRIDLNPGPETEIISNLPTNVVWFTGWLVTLDRDGNYQWGHAYVLDTRVTQQQSFLESVQFTGITVDGDGNVIIGGYFGGSMPGDTNELVILTENPQPVFVAYGAGNHPLLISYDPYGNRRWIRYYGTELENVVDGNMGGGVAVDQAGDVYFTGTFKGVVDFDPPNNQTRQSFFNGSYHSSVFVLKLDTDGRFLWVRTFEQSGASPYYQGQRVVADGSGVCVAGFFGGTFGHTIDLDPGAGTQTHNSANGNGFMVKLDHDGDYVWSRNFGSTTWSGGGAYPQTTFSAMTVSATGRISLGGHFRDSFYAPVASGQARGAAIMQAVPGDATAWLMKIDQPDLWESLAIDSDSLPDLVHHVEAEIGFRAMGGTGVYSWSLASGALPAGMSANFDVPALTLTIFGAPETLGEHAFELRLTDDAGNEYTQPFIIHVVPLPPVEIAPVILPSGREGESYTALIEAVGGLGSYQWTLLEGELPPGLSGISGVGEVAVIIGRPSLRGRYQFTVQADGPPGYSDVRDFTLDIAAGSLMGGGGAGGCALGPGSESAAVTLLLLALLMLRSQAKAERSSQ